MSHSAAICANYGLTVKLPLYTTESLQRLLGLDSRRAEQISLIAAKCPLSSARGQLEANLLKCVR